MNIPIMKMFIPPNQYPQKSPYTMKVKGVVLHNTAGTASARQEAVYMINRNAEGSMHFYVDETEAVQTLPISRTAWHASDGGTGYANRNLIGIEICRSHPDDRYFNAMVFERAENNACWVAAKVCIDIGVLPSDKTIRWHREFASTACPYRSAQKGGRERIINLVKKYYEAIKGEIMKDDKVKVLHSKAISVRTGTEFTVLNVKDGTYSVAIDGVSVGWVNPNSIEATHLKIQNPMGLSANTATEFEVLNFENGTYTLGINGVPIGWINQKYVKKV